MAKIPKDSTRLRDLEQTQKNLVREKEVEIKKVDEHWNTKINAARVNGQDKLGEAYTLNLSQIEEANQTKVDKLSSYQEQLEKTKQILEKEEFILKDHQQAKLNDIKTNFNKTLLDNQTKNETALEDMSSDVGSVRERIEAEKTAEIEDMNFESKIALDQNSKRNEKVLRSTNLQHSQMKRANDIAHVKATMQQKKEQLQEKEIILKGHKDELDTRTTAHQNKLMIAENQNAELLKKQDESFKQKFEFMKSSHNQVLQNTNDRLKKQVEELKQAQSKVFNARAEKTNDQFYQLVKLNPTIVDHPDHYEVTLKVPAYEEQNIYLSGRKRKIGLNFSRRFQENLVDADKSSYETKKSEVIKKSWNVSDIVDPTQVKRSYQNGHLKFIMKKA